MTQTQTLLERAFWSLKRRYCMEYCRTETQESIRYYETDLEVAFVHKFNSKFYEVIVDQKFTTRFNAVLPDWLQTNLESYIIMHRKRKMFREALKDFPPGTFVLSPRFNDNSEDNNYYLHGDGYYYKFCGIIHSTVCCSTVPEMKKFLDNYRKRKEAYLLGKPRFQLTLLQRELDTASILNDFNPNSLVKVVGDILMLETQRISDNIIKMIRQAIDADDTG